MTTIPTIEQLAAKYPHATAEQIAAMHGRLARDAEDAAERGRARVVDAAKELAFRRARRLGDR